MIEIKGIIFDLGKVVFDLSEDLIIKNWEASSNKQLIDFRSDLRFIDLSHRFEKADISAVQLRKGVLEILEIDLSDMVFDNGWCSLYLEPYLGINKLLARLKHNYKIVALTNTNIIHAKVWKEKYKDILNCFESVFSSHEIKSRKPEKKSFEIVIKYLGLEPRKILFLDDNPNNIDAAKELGIKTILVNSQLQMFNDLKKMGIK
jgi:glucose-1-phosphatase